MGHRCLPKVEGFGQIRMMMTGIDPDTTGIIFAGFVHTVVLLLCSLTVTMNQTLGL